MECEIHLKLGAPRESGCCVPSLARAKISVGVAYSWFWHCCGVRASCTRRGRAVKSANAIPFIKIKTPPAFYDFISTALNMLCAIQRP